MNSKEEIGLRDVSAPRPSPLVLAHRGARLEAPENTLPAFQRAIDIGADGIELDAILTSDKVPVITHNDDLSILTKVRGYVHAMPFDSVRTLDMGSHFSAQFAGTTMPTLAEALELTSRNGLLTVVEIKPQPGLKVSQAKVIGGLISDMKMHGPVVVSSYSKTIVRALARWHPKLTRAFVMVRPPFPFFPFRFFVKKQGISAIHAMTKAMSQNHLRRMKAIAELFAWTVNDAEDVAHCLAAGVDGIITDDVPFVRECIDGFVPKSRR